MAVKTKMFHATRAGKFRAGNHPKISITFDDELFDIIHKNAVHWKCSFAEAVRRICRYAFEAADREDARKKSAEEA